MRISNLSSAIFIFTFTSCSSTSVLTLEPVTFPAAQTVDYHEMPIYASRQVPFSTEYEIIAQVVAVVDAGQRPERPLQLLRKEAAKIGADALIDMQLNFSAGFANVGLKATATAIRFKR